MRRLLHALNLWAKLVAWAERTNRRRREDAFERQLTRGRF